MKRLFIIVFVCVAGCQEQVTDSEPELPDPPVAKTNITADQLASGDPIINSLGMTLIPIPAGEFLMGSSEDDDDRKDNESQHKVRLTLSYYLGATEVTQGQWKSLIGTEPWSGKKYVQEGSDCAATYVNWEDAVNFCRILSKTEGLDYRLPTEAEWEYACRAGRTTSYSFGSSSESLGDYAWFSDNTSANGELYAHRVGQKLPNAWELYDMHGNVLELCRDRHGPYPTEVVTNPPGQSWGINRVIRGGSWNLNARSCRSAFRGSRAPVLRVNYLGFRVAMSPPQAGS